MQWDHIDSYNFHGIPSGYIVKYKNYNEENYHEVRVPYEASDVTLVKLRPYTVYIVTVCGYTAVGNGPRASNIQKTLEGGKTFVLVWNHCFFRIRIERFSDDSLPKILMFTPEMLQTLLSYIAAAKHGDTS